MKTLSMTAKSVIAIVVVIVLIVLAVVLTKSGQKNSVPAPMDDQSAVSAGQTPSGTSGTIGTTGTKTGSGTVTAKLEPANDQPNAVTNEPDNLGGIGCWPTDADKCPTNDSRITLHGLYDGSGGTAVTWFEYWTVGPAVDVHEKPIDGTHMTTPQVVQTASFGKTLQMITKLQLGATYHYRIVVKNSLGTAQGNIVEFKVPTATY